MSIEELLRSLQEKKTTLGDYSPKEIWRKIGSKDNFEELGLNSNDLKEALTDFITDNPYHNL